jgi:hypothetical protein
MWRTSRSSFLFSVRMRHQDNDAGAAFAAFV